MKLADLTQDERISLGVAAAKGIKDNLPVDAFGQERRLNDYADIWGAAARNAVLVRLGEIVAARRELQS
jgi:hypothetical protein